MTRLSVITKSYRNDFELCADLARSFPENVPDTVPYQIFVPRRDLKMFGQLANSHTLIRYQGEVLPRSFLHMAAIDYTLNLSRPFPPIRGWILQQVAKLSAAAESDADVVLIVDSDVEFIRPFSPETFVRDGVVRLYRLPGAIDERLPRHVLWHNAARKLLGLPQQQPPFADYIHGMVALDPAIVRRMLAHIARVTGLRWEYAIASQLHFSEWTLYGVYVDEVMGAPASSFASEDPLCLGHWGTVPLDRDSAVEFFRQVGPADIAVMISAKSGTPLAVKRAAFAEYRAGGAGGRSTSTAGLGD